MIPISIDHDRLIALGTVVDMAEKYVHIGLSHPDYKWWENHLKDAKHVVKRLEDVHVRDARENGACEKCAPELFRHAQELAAFDEQLKAVSA